MSKNRKTSDKKYCDCCGSDLKNIRRQRVINWKEEKGGGREAEQVIVCRKCWLEHKQKIKNYPWMAEELAD